MNIKELRKSQKKTQEEVACALKLQKQTYQNYELGKREPSIEILKNMADYFDVSLDMLIGRPRPYDLPSSTTEEQKQIINKILELSNEQCKLVEAYITGLQVGQEKLNDTIKKLSN